MQKFRYNGMPEGSFVVNKPQEAIEVFKQMCGCDVRQVVFPHNGWATYYISEDARCFGIKWHRLTNKYAAYEMSLATDVYKPNMMPQYLLRPDLGHQVKVRADRLVYCTFKLGEWRKDIQPKYKDGDRNNCKLDNLYLESEIVQDFAPIRNKMERYTELYEQNFMMVARYIAYCCKYIEFEDAKDAAQEAFLWLTGKDYEFNLGHWMKYGKYLGFQHIRKENVDNIDYVPIGRYDNGYEIDVTEFVTNPTAKKYLELYLEGYEQHEIMRMLGVERSLLSYHIRHSRKIIKEELSQDIKWLMLG